MWGWTQNPSQPKSISARVLVQSRLKARLSNVLDHATLLEVVRCAMTLPLPHFRQRKRLTN
jgi:hypothetical protein